MRNNEVPCELTTRLNLDVLAHFKIYISFLANKLACPIKSLNSHLVPLNRSRRYTIYFAMLLCYIRTYFFIRHNVLIRKIFHVNVVCYSPKKKVSGAPSPVSNEAVLVSNLSHSPTANTKEPDSWTQKREKVYGY